MCHSFPPRGRPQPRDTSQLRRPLRQCVDVVAEGDHLLPEGGRLFGPRQLGFVILGFAAAGSEWGMGMPKSRTNIFFHVNNLPFGQAPLY